VRSVNGLNDSYGSVAVVADAAPTTGMKDRPGSGPGTSTRCASIQRLYVFDKPDPKRNRSSPLRKWPRSGRAFQEHARTAVSPAQEQDKGLRIGSTTARDERYAVTFRDTPLGWLESAMGVHPHLRSPRFHNIRRVDGKALAGAGGLLAAYRIDGGPLMQRASTPLHLGVTEAG